MLKYLLKKLLKSLLGHKGSSFGHGGFAGTHRKYSSSDYKYRPHGKSHSHPYKRKYSSYSS